MKKVSCFFLVLLTFQIIGFKGGAQTLLNSSPLGGSPVSGGGAFATNAKLLNLISSLDGISNASIYENIAIKDIEGSMYFDSAFKKGTVYLNKKAFGVFQMRYNALNDEFEIKLDNKKDVQVLARNKTVSCKKDNVFYHFKDFASKRGELFSGYLIGVVTNGKYKLYQRKIKVFKEGSDAKTSFHKTIPHKFLDKTEFYLEKGDGYPQYLKPSKKELLSHLDKEDAQRLKTFLKNKKNIDFKKNLQEMASVISYINSQ